MTRLELEHLPEYIQLFASKIPITRLNSPLSLAAYFPDQHRIRISSADLNRTDVSMLFHEIAHAWHYEKIKGTAGRSIVHDMWSPVNDTDQYLHDLFFDRRDRKWTSDTGLTYDNLALESGHGGRIDEPTLRDLCKCKDVVHYAMCTPDEFFAVLSDMYWAKESSDWPPHTREGLKEFDPDAYALIKRLWRHDISS